MSYVHAFTAFFKKLIISQGLRQSSLTVVGNSAATFFSALALIMISRLLGPDKFGEFTVGFAIVLIVNKINDLGLNTVLLKHTASLSTQEEKSALFSHTLVLKLIGFVTILFCAWLITFTAHSLQSFVSPYLFLAVGLSIASTLYEHLLATAQSLHLFAQAVAINATQSVLKCVLIAVLFLTHISDPYLSFTIYMLIPIAPVLCYRLFTPDWLQLQIGQLPHKLSGLLVTAPHAAVGSIISGLIENIDVLFVRGYLSAYETGLLGGVSKIAMVITMVGFSLGNVLYPRVSRYKQSSDLHAYLKKSWFVVAISVVGFVCCIPFTSLMIQWTIGREYIAGQLPLMLLLASAFLTVATIPFLALFYTLEHNRYFSISGIVQLCIIVVGNYAFVPSFGLEAAAWTRLFSRIALFVLTVTWGVIALKKKYADA